MPVGYTNCTSGIFVSVFCPDSLAIQDFYINLHGTDFFGPKSEKMKYV